MPLITAQHLSKSFQIPVREPGLAGAFRAFTARQYTTVHALSDVSFSIEPGELVGYIGPNGAGKSTTVKILSGILVPTSGDCKVGGRTPWLERKQHVRDIGVVFGQRTQLWWDLPVLESFDLLRDIYSVPAAEYTRRKADLVDRLEIGDILSRPVRQLSLGQRMRCDLAAALLHSPSVLFLDEPTIGLDAISKLTVRGFVREMNRDQGVTVILTTHDMDDIEALCSRVILIGAGRMLLDGSVEELRNRVSRERYLIVDLDDPQASVTDEAAEVVQSDHGRCRLRFDPEVVSAAQLIARITAAHPVKDLFVEQPPIEEVVARLYREIER